MLYLKTNKNNQINFNVLGGASTFLCDKIVNNFFILIQFPLQMLYRRIFNKPGTNSKHDNKFEKKNSSGNCIFIIILFILL